MKGRNLFQTLGELLHQQIDPNTRAEEIWHRYGKQRAVMMLDSSGFSLICRIRQEIRCWAVTFRLGLVLRRFHKIGKWAGLPCIG